MDNETLAMEMLKELKSNIAQTGVGFTASMCWTV